MADMLPVHSPSNRQPRPGRPFSVLLLAAVVLSSAGLSLIRLAQAAGQWAFWAEFKSYLPAYLVFSGLVCGLIGLAVFWGLWCGRPWAPRITRFAALAFAFYYWLDRLLLAAYPQRSANWPFALGLTLALLAWTWWVFSRPKVKQFFGELHERR